jgi:hypothetical protein
MNKDEQDMIQSDEGKGIREEEKAFALECNNSWNGVWKVGRKAGSIAALYHSRC